MHSFFHLLFTLGLLALVAAMIRPALTARFIATPTRKKILVRMLPALIVIAALSGVTKPKMADDAETTTASSGGQAYADTDMSPEKRRWLDTKADAKRVLQRASARVDAAGCSNSSNQLEEYLDSGAKRTLADFMLPPGTPGAEVALNTGLRAVTGQLEVYMQVARANCGVVG